MEEIDIKLTVHELDLTIKCLAKQPFEVVNGLITKIVNQANSRPMAAASPGAVLVEGVPPSGASPV